MPGTHGQGPGGPHVLYGEHYRPIGYLVEKIAVDNPWDSLEPRFFLTTSHAEAMRLLATTLNDLPRREEAAVG